jgi:thioredoxin-related protein
MRKRLLVLFFLLIHVYSFSQQGRPADELFDEAITKAKKEHKNVFVILTATWCGPCKYLKRGLTDVYNVQYFDKNYVVLELYSSTLDRTKGLVNEGAKTLLAKYNGDTTAFPYWLIVNPLKKKLYGELGFSNSPQDLKNFINVIKKTSRLNQSELDMILERFRQIALLVPED